jgi:thymidine phosphorylase
MSGQMDARALLARLRHRGRLEPDHMRWVGWALGNGAMSDTQAAAFAMGVCLNGLDQEARVALTLAMRDSGDVLEWALDGPVLDKHSTGGVGDCVSLVLAPALAACGAYVPMISGRGLGHTGGTLDKLESIPGLSTDCDGARLREIVSATGCAIVGATARIAPADRRLYAVRDVTATVDSLDLITASILSKKLAAGLDGLVLDVKCGSGAFMKDLEAARELATSLCETANAAGCPTTAVISDMNQPVAGAVGNALEIGEVMRTLSGAAKGPLWDLSCALGGALLAQGGLAATSGQGQAQIARAIATGAALERFAKMVADLGGPTDFDSRWHDCLPAAPVVRAVPAQSAGYVAAIDGEGLGLAAIDLGAGRRVETDRIDPAVGLADLRRLGDSVMPGDPLALVHAANEADAERAMAQVQAAITVSARPPRPVALILERM